MDQVSDFIAAEMDRLYPDGVYPYSTLLPKNREAFLNDLLGAPRAFPDCPLTDGDDE